MTSQSHAHTHARMHARTHARTDAHTLASNLSCTPTVTIVHVILLPVKFSKLSSLDSTLNNIRLYGMDELKLAVPTHLSKGHLSRPCLMEEICFSGYQVKCRCYTQTSPSTDSNVGMGKLELAVACALKHVNSHSLPLNLSKVYQFRPCLTEEIRMPIWLLICYVCTQYYRLCLIVSQMHITCSSK